MGLWVYLPLMLGYLPQSAKPAGSWKSRQSVHTGVTDDSSRDGFGYYMSRVYSVRRGFCCKTCAALSNVPIPQGCVPLGCVSLARWVRGVARSELVENYVLRQVRATAEVCSLEGERIGGGGETGQTATERNTRE